jgi:UDP-N-acetylmuramoylalanine--D-glutamate ligase
MKNFKNKKVTIIGLGLHGGGVGAAKFFSREGARVLVTDLRSEQELKSSLEQLEDYSVKYVLGQHRSEDFINADLVIKNPAVPDKSKYLQIAKEHNVPIDTDMGVFFELCPVPVIGITGTKGKSTVAALTTKFLKRKYSDVVLAGNIRTSVLEILELIGKKTKVVLELSSWQLAGLRQHRKSPHCSVVTNILPDHLNRYRSMADYVKDKKEIFRWQKSKDILVLNYDDKTVREMADEAKKPQIYYYTKENGTSGKEYKGEIGAVAKGEKISYQGEEVCSFEDIKLRGEHNISNVLAAINVAKIYNISNKGIKKVLNSFSGLEGRLELIDTVKKVKYINDTTATMPEAVLAALTSFPLKRNIILLAGGADKELSFEELARVIAKRVKALILLEGTATAKLKKEVEAVNPELEMLGPLNSMKKAVVTAKNLSDENDVVLLSPACASFGLFKHEFDRGEQFNQAVKSLK